WFELARRTGDHLQHFGSCRLLLQRFGQFARSRLHLVEQPHVLDGDDRLVGKGLEQLDLLIGERPYVSAQQSDRTDWYTFTQQRCAQPSPVAREPLHLCLLVFWVGEHVGDLDRSAFQCGSSNERPTSG